MVWSTQLNPELGGLAGNLANYAGNSNFLGNPVDEFSTKIASNNVTTNVKPTGSFLGDLNMDKLGNIAGLAGSLANTFMGFKQLGLAEDAFNFNKAMKEKEYAMAKDAYDRNVARARSIGDQMRAGGVN